MDNKKDESKRRDQIDIAGGDALESVTGGVVISGDSMVGASKTINTGGGAYVGGNIHVGGGDFVGRDKYEYAKHSVDSADKIARSFREIYSAIDAKLDFDEVDKNDLKTEVQDIEEEVRKGFMANESFLSRRLRNIQRIASDISDVVLITLNQPGITTVIREMAARMQRSK